MSMKCFDSIIVEFKLGSFLICGEMYFGVVVGDEEDHDNDRGRWEGTGGPLIHASLPQVCPIRYSHHRI